MTDEEKLKALNEAIAAMNKRFGAHTVQKLGDKPLDCDVIPTGSLALDLALGVGGVPKQRITVIKGLPGAGKTTLMQHLIAEAQALGEQVCYIDMEHKLDPKYAQNCGVDLESCVFSQPPNGVAALEIARAMIPNVGLVVVDSVYQLVTPEEVESDVGAQHFAKLARLMSQEIKKIQPRLGMSSCALVFINQVRTGIGASGRTYYTDPGGFALKFSASVLIQMKKIGELPKTDEMPQGAGIISEARVTKNNVAPPFKVAEINIRHSYGIDKDADLLNAAVSAGSIERAGAWYKWRGENIAKSSGRLPVLEVLRQKPELAREIREETLRVARE